MEFQLGFWDPGKFGYIFRSISHVTDQLDLLYSAEDISLKLVLNQDSVIAQVQLDPNLVLRNNWFDIEIRFDESVSLKVDGHTEVTSHKFFPASIGFGVSSDPETITVEVPPMAVRNIIYYVNDELTYWWPLNESNGEIGGEKMRNATARIKNPYWLRSTQFHWEERARISIKGYPAITFDTSAQQLSIFNTNEVHHFDLIGNQWSVDQYPPLKFPDMVKYGYYHPFQEGHYLYDLEPSNILFYHPDSMKFSVLTSSTTVRQEIWKHAAFFNPLDSAIYLTAGYGYFLAKNSIFKLVKGKPIEVPINGSVMQPRYSLGVAAIGQGNFYLFGGMGNASGRQELGFMNFYDLWRLNLNDSTMNQVLELEIPSSHFLPAPNMIYDSIAQSIFLLGYSNFTQASPNLALLKLDLNSETIEAVSDSLKMLTQSIDQSDAFLWLNPRTTELIAVVRNSDNDLNTEIIIYSLLYPPEAPESVHLSTPIIARPWIWIIVISVFGVILIGWWVFGGGKKVNKSKTAQSGYSPPAAGLIRLFGNFSIMDARGQDITGEFSPKLRELLCALILKDPQQPGILTKTLNDWLWPGMEGANVKNTRGVTINRLRESLEALPGTRVEYQGERWVLILSGDMGCDYWQFLDLNSPLDSVVEIKTFLDLVSPGPLLSNMDVEWLDAKKSQINSQVIDMLVASSKKLAVTEDLRLQEKIADAILQFDDINEEGLELKIKALLKAGKTGMANQFYQNFAARYQRLLQCRFPRDFSEFHI